MLTLLLYAAFGLAAPHQHPAPPDVEGQATIVHGRFSRLLTHGADNLQELSKSKEGGMSCAPPPMLGVFSPSEDAPPTMLVVLTIDEAHSASMVWASSRCTLVVRPSTWSFRNLGAYVASAGADVASLDALPIMEIVADGRAGIARVSISDTAVATSEFLVTSHWLDSVKAQSLIDGSPQPRGGLRSLDTPTYAAWMSNEESAIGSLGRLPRSKARAHRQLTVIHPQTRLASIASFTQKQSDYPGALLTPQLPNEYPELVLWPDGRIVRLTGIAEDGRTAYESGRFEISALAKVVTDIQSARQTLPGHLVGGEFGPHASIASASILGFGEPVMLSVDRGNLGGLESAHSGSGGLPTLPMTAAYRQLHGFFASVPITDRRVEEGLEFQLVTLVLEDRFVPEKVRSSAPKKR